MYQPCIAATPISGENILQLLPDSAREYEANTSSGDEVVSRPVRGPDVSLLVRHHVLVVVHPGKWDLFLRRSEGWHREHFHLDVNLGM